MALHPENVEVPTAHRWAPAGTVPRPRNVARGGRGARAVDVVLAGLVADEASFARRVRSADRRRVARAPVGPVDADAAGRMA